MCHWLMHLAPVNLHILCSENYNCINGTVFLNYNSNCTISKQLLNFNSTFLHEANLSPTLFDEVMLSDPIATWVTATDVSFSLLLHSAGLPEFVQTTWRTCQLILNSFQLSKRTICLQNEPFCIAIAQSSWVKSIWKNLHLVLINSPCQFHGMQSAFMNRKFKVFQLGSGSTQKE